MMTKNNDGWHLENSYAQLPEAFFTETSPEHSPSPQIVMLNESLCGDLGLDPQMLNSEEGIAILAGNRIPDGGKSIAQAYAGHQFGHFTMLGDGRAVLLGEQIMPNGKRVDIQLKGSGRTPFSRGGDGRAALGPMLREYLISEAMHALKIPTTRSLAVTVTGAPVYREEVLPGAILTRVALSHLRVGTFQYAAARQETDDLRTLADYAIHRHYPHIENDKNPYHTFLKSVIERQAELVAKWQLVGFIHGVMNTDNVSISGETIDYGPCAFMDTYDPSTVFSSIDREGRYAYGNQPGITEWNLSRFAETLLPLLHEDTDEAVNIAQEAISGFAERFHRYWMAGMRSKIGIFNEEKEDMLLVKKLLRIMQDQKADYTNTFRAFTLNKAENLPFFDHPEFQQWLKEWKDRLSRQTETEEEAYQLMKESNPAIIPRNHRVEEALESAVENGDLRAMERLLAALSDPYSYSEKQEVYIAPSNSTDPYQTYCGT